MMSTLRSAIVALALLGGTTAAGAGQLLREHVASPALGRDMPYVVYLPDDYQDGTFNYPVLYLLHGAGGDENAWSTMGDVQAKADRLIASGAIAPTIIVMPGCRGCWWVDGAKDKAETAFWNDLVPQIDRRYRTIDSRDGRAIAGLSAGGYGTVRYALRYPDRLAAAAALSPAVYSETPPKMSAARTQPPFLLAGGDFDQEAWDRQNYPVLMKSYFAQSRRVPLYLVSGDNDRYGIAFETALLFKRVFDRQDLVELRVVDGGHSWKVWANAFEGALRYVSGFMARPRTLEGIAAAPAPVTPARNAMVVSKR